MDDEDWYDFPPAKYPGREAITFGLVVTVVLTLIVWSVWKVVVWFNA